MGVGDEGSAREVHSRPGSGFGDNLGTQVLPLLSTSAVAADDGMKWQFSEANDPDNKGRMTARLIYGIPETDAIQASGVCEARSGSGLQASSLMLGADIGDLEDGKEVDVHFSGGGFDRTRKGVVRQPTSEEGSAAWSSRSTMTTRSGGL